MATTVNKERTDYTEGSILYSIIMMGLPSMIGFLTQHIYSLVDMYWVSKLPQQEAAVAGITFFSNIMWLFFSFNQLVGPGSVAVISRRYGEREFDLAEKAIKETLVLKLAFGVLFAVAGYFSLDRMLRLIGAEGEALVQSIAYGRIMFLGMPVMFATYSVFTALRGVANPHQAMVLMIGSNVLNLVVAPFFIFGWLGLPAWGVRGAAFASVLCFTLTFLVGTALFYTRAANVRLHLRGRERMTLESMWKMIRIGVPAWLGDMSWAGSRLIITSMVAPFGTAVVAAYGVGNQVTAFGIMLLVGIGLGLSALIGHNLGAAKHDRARKTADQALLLGAGVMIIFGAITFVFARDVIGLFFDAAGTVEVGRTMLRIFALGYPFLGAFIMMEEIFMGAGWNTPPMVMNLITSWGLQAAPVLVLANHFALGETSVWWTLTLANVIMACAFYLYYRRGRWLTARV